MRHDSTSRRAFARRYLTRAVGALGCVALVTAGTAAMTSASTPSARRGHQAPHTGGNLTVLEGSTFIGNWPEGLDPATNLNGLANASLMDAVFGELFEVGPHAKVIDDLASGYKLTNGARTFVLELRHGLKFTDGTPLNAAAVVFNWKRDLVSVSPAKPPWPAVSSITASGPYTVVVKFKSPDGAVINQFQSSNANWMASPTALKRLGSKRFALFPVGAGPFKVVSDIPTNKLVLKRNPHYWQSGHPYLNSLTFLTVANDEAALEELRAGGAQAYELMLTPQLVSGFRSAGFNVTASSGTAPLDVQINTLVPPFTNKLAREALYYATDSKAINKSVYAGTCPVAESFTGPGGLFYEPKVPGYRTYNLAKAKAIVKQLGGLSFTMYYGQLGQGRATAEALQTMYQSAGMKVQLSGLADLASVIQEYDTHKWQIFPAAIGSWDPAAGIGVAFRLASYGPFTGVKSSAVDHYIAAGIGSTSPAARARAYANLGKVLSNEADTPFICSPTSWDIAKKGVTGPGLTSETANVGEGSLVLWEDVSVSK